MTKYMIYYMDKENIKRYVTAIYRNSISSSCDIGDSVEFEDKMLALNLRDELNKRDDHEYKVIAMETSFAEVEEDTK